MQLESRRILILEDDASIAELLGIVLEAEGYAVQLATTALEARLLMERTAPDVLILDLALPDVDGIQFLRSLRDKPKWSTLPVIVVSAYPYLLDGETVSATFTKPPDVAELVAAVESALKPQPLTGAT